MFVFCWSTAGALQEHCRSTAGALKEHCCGPLSTGQVEKEFKLQSQNGKLMAVDSNEPSRWGQNWFYEPDAISFNLRPNFISLAQMSIFSLASS